MTVAKFVQPDRAGGLQSGTVYPANIDASIAVLAELAAQFSVSAQDVPNLTIAMRAGRIYKADRTFVEMAAQNSAALTAPTANPRRDIVYVDATTGVIGVAQGAETGSPVDPAIPPNKIPKARIRWTVAATQITNSMIDDLRQDAPSIEAIINYLAGNLNSIHVLPAGFYFPSAESPPTALKVVVAAGSIFVTGALVANAAQTVTLATAHATLPRIDRVVVDALTGVASKIDGTANASPVPPAITSGKLPVAQVLVTAAMTVVANTAITDERVAIRYDQPQAQIFTASGTFNAVLGGNYLVTAIGGGGGGGGGGSGLSGKGGGGGYGGSGGALYYSLVTLSAGQAVTVTIGTGGSGGSGGVGGVGGLPGVPGTGGGNTVFGSFFSALGGNNGNPGYFGQMSSISSEYGGNGGGNGGGAGGMAIGGGATGGAGQAGQGYGAGGGGGGGGGPTDGSGGAGGPGGSGILVVTRI